MMVCNPAQLLRKRHLNRRVAQRDNPTPWRELFDLLKDVLLGLARVETAREAPPAKQRRSNRIIALEIMHLAEDRLPALLWG